VWFIPSIAAGLISILISGFIWTRILTWLGANPPRAAVGLFLQAQLGKYVPGSVWQYAGRVSLSGTYGIATGIAARSLPIELAAMICAAALFAFLLIGWWGLAVVIGLLVAARLVESRLEQGAARNTLRASLFYATTWPLIGASFWITGHALAQIPVNELAFYTGVFSVAWLAGLAAIYAPGGLGVREAVIVALLRGKVGDANAVLIAIASRAVFTLCDLGGAAIAVIFVSKSRLQGRRARTDEAV
jgi:hypothetical protein